MKHTSRTILLTLMLIWLPMVATSAMVVWGGKTDDGTATGEAYGGGSGTEDDPFLITTPGQLVYLMTQTNKQANYNVDVYYKQMDDFDLNGSMGTSAYIWTPIGNGSNCFRGHYDGNGFSVRNIYFKGVTNVGFFGSIAGATVENLSVYGPLTFERMGDMTYFGAVVGRTDKGVTGGTVINCHNYASIDVTTAKLQYIGGIVGYGKKLVLSRCSNRGDISVTTTTSSSNEVCVGGLVGSIVVSSENTNYSINRCFNRGNIAITCTYTSSAACNRYVGGLVGQDKGNKSTGNMELSSCYSHATISMNISGATSLSGSVVMGGLVGYSVAGEIRDSYSHTCFDLSGQTTPKYLTGCIIGQHDVGNHGYVSNCYYASVCTCTNTTPAALPKTDDEMRSDDFLHLLNQDDEAFSPDDESDNDGFPILRDDCHRRVTIRSNNDAWGTVQIPTKR